MGEAELPESTDRGTTTAPQTSKVATIAAAHSVHDTYSSFLPPLLPVFIGMPMAISGSPPCYYLADDAVFHSGS